MSANASLLSSLGAALALRSLSPRKDMHKHKRSWSMPSTLERHPTLSQIAGDVDRLEEREQPSCSYYSADWLGEALEVVLNACNSTSALGFDIDGTGKRVNQHLEDMVHLLDICNVLRDSISEIRKQQTCVQVAIRGLGVSAHERAARSLASLSSLKNKGSQSRLDKCMSTLRRMANTLNLQAKAKAGSDEEAFMAINHAKAITILLCSALVASFSINPLRMPSLSVSPALTNLQRKLKQSDEMRRWNSKGRLLVELDRADVALENLNNRLNCKSKLQMHLEISAINMAFQESDRALALLDQKINHLFKACISVRVALLNSLSSC